MWNKHKLTQHNRVIFSSNLTKHAVLFNHSDLFCLSSANKSIYLGELARENTQLLFNEIWQVTQTSN